MLSIIRSCPAAQQIEPSGFCNAAAPLQLKRGE
jgi:hypothetical protein